MHDSFLRELDEILDRIDDLTERAVHAARSVDCDTLQQCLTDRERILDRARRLTPPVPPSTLPSRVRDSLTRIAQADLELTAAVRHTRDATRAGLDSVRKVAAAAEGYAGVMPRHPRLDLVR